MPSLSMRVIEAMLRLKGKASMVSERAFRDHFEVREYPTPAAVARAVTAKCHVDERFVQGRRVFTLTPKRARPRVHFIYTHGGAYVHELLVIHWNLLAKLARRTDAAITVPLYPLAPEHSYTEAYRLLEVVYRDVVEQTPAETVILCGDSAGGGLALAQAMRYRDMGLPMPGRVILFSPWLDITMTNPEVSHLERVDVMLGAPGLIQAGKWWAGGDDPRLPALSPIFGDLSGLPPIDVFQGTHDILLPDARKLKTAVAAAGGEINLYEYEGAFHVFVAATFTPEAEDVFRRIAATVATA